MPLVKQTSNATRLVQSGSLIILFLTAAASFASAQRRLPDLVISSVTIQKSPTINIAGAESGFVKSVTVTVTNACGAASGTSYVLVTFKKDNSANAKPIYFIGNTVKALKVGESFTQTFNLPVHKIAVGEFIYIEADPYKKVVESNEANNWRTLFPSGAGEPTVCK